MHLTNGSVSMMPLGSMAQCRTIIENMKESDKLVKGSCIGDSGNEQVIYNNTKNYKKKVADIKQQKIKQVKAEKAKQMQVAAKKKKAKNTQTSTLGNIFAVQP